jgi:hypothetical protein
VTDIGLKSDGCSGVVTLGIGRILARFHWCGTMLFASDILNNRASGLANTGDPSLRNHAGNLSSPVPVGCRRSRALNTCHSEIASSYVEGTMQRLDGGW